LSSKQEKRQRLRKAKSGKIDTIEDVLSTEELKGSYEERDKTAKILAIDRAHQLDAHRMKLREFRRQEVEAYQAQLPTKEEEELIQRRVEYVLLHLCEPRAFEYLSYLRIHDHQLCKRVVFCLLREDRIMDRLEEICARIFKHGAPKKKITMKTIVKWMRAITGRKTKIEVERDGKREEFGIHLT